MRVPVAGFVAPALFFNIGPMEVVEEDGDAPLDEEVGDQLHEDGGQDQLQVLLHVTRQVSFVVLGKLAQEIVKTSKRHENSKTFFSLVTS